VNFSAVEGPLNPQAAKSLGVEPGVFFATGVSIVLHPNNPMVPIIHMNIRYFEMDGGEYWFGVGIDLTPHYIQEDQARTFHQALKNTCDKHNPDFYPEFKVWADDYFFIKHRNETRGIGGIFFDRLNQETRGLTKEELFNFVLDVGKTFAPVYTKFMSESHHLPFIETQRSWQLLRRGRYVEFNLVYDRGTRFGLETGGRTESILMSLPNQANWAYDFQTEAGSPEEKTLSLLKKGLQWA
jgi:coproporphyrinogen III oxidase